MTQIFHICHAFYQTISIETPGVDLSNSFGPTRLLVGRTHIRMPRVYGHGDVGYDTRFR